MHHGGVGAIRSLGRLGVPVHAVSEDRFTPAAVSRYTRGVHVWRTTGAEPQERLLAGLLRIGERIGRPALLIPTDEEAAVLVAEHQDALNHRFLFPRNPEGLVRAVASKQGLHELCLRHGVSTPRAAFPESRAEVLDFARTAVFPVVAKNRDPFARRASPAVPGTTRIDDAETLAALAEAWGEHPGVVLQEYLPRADAEDWIVHMHTSAAEDARVLFTAVKARSWPPHAGMTAMAVTTPNDELAQLSADFCKEIGFAGVCDLDWRFDRRDGRYKLLDFNPRIGAQFRLFETRARVDLVRALHLHLTGRRIPAAPQIEGRRIVVENIDLLARLAYRGSDYRTPSLPPRSRWTETELGWWAKDDPLPFPVMLARSVRPGLRYVAATRTRHA
ncbi:carboxylate--amine ligase [Streptacidiphilus rugosus]|uniref:carboxylate--amine ligase n=1 Tax=Streptacidiphilus rugosus TaxID=405783 RepID=UPI001E4CF3D7|nr:ATP-grasp domain-containing protein [Streptacidiphilus rugosus]